MALLKTDAVQIGQNATPSQNMHLRANNDGSFTLARGNEGSGTQDLLTIDANGRVAMPQTLVAFSAYQSSLQSLATSVFIKVSLQAEEFDTTSAFDATTNYRFQPLVAGYYQVSGCVATVGSAGEIFSTIYKNGSEYKRGGDVIPTNGFGAHVAALVYLNGSTDYLELFAYQASGSSKNTVANAAQTYFQGILVAKA